MKFSTRLVERYIAAAIMPYILLSLLLLTAVLVAQQGSRFTELIGQVQAPLAYVIEIMIGITPGLLLFTIPMAVLAGTLIGFSRMGSDSELIALRAAGVGISRLLSAPAVIGLAATIAALYLGVFYAPVAAGRLRDVAVRAALSRLKSPIRPGTFTTNFGDKIIYVQRGDEARGEWKGVLVFSQETDGGGLLVTAERGRLDSSSEVAELVLYDTVATTLTLPSEQARKKQVGASDTAPAKNSNQIINERSAYLRIKLDEKLGSLIERLRTRQPELDELSWESLLNVAETSRNPQQQRAARIVLHKKAALGVTPLWFALLGAAIGLRVQRGGRGIGMVLSLAVMIAYYLLVLAGEQLARTAILPVPVGMWLASGSTALAAIAMLTMPRSPFTSLLRFFRTASSARRSDLSKPQYSGCSVRRFSSYTSALFGLLDRSLFSAIARNFIFALIALTSVFLVFTLFELWRHIAANSIGWDVVVEYFLFLIPFVAASLASVSVLVATIFSYAVISRRSEAIAWLAAGQSIYRLLIPGLLLASVVGVTIGAIQDRLLPYTNRRQDALRTQIRGGNPQALAPSGRQWTLSSDGRFLFSYVNQGQGESRMRIEAPIVFEYAGYDSVRIGRVLFAENGEVVGGNLIKLSDSKSIQLARTGEGQSYPSAETILIPLQASLMETTPRKLSHLDSGELKMLGAKTSSKALSADINNARLTLETRTVDAVTPLVMVLLAMPLAIAFGRRSALVSLCAAVFVGVLFWGMSSGLKLLGTYGLLPVEVAAWGTSIVFSVLGSYLLTRTRT